MGRERPAIRAPVASDLFAATQDVFNRTGVQIMSPHYFMVPARPEIVRPQYIELKASVHRKLLNRLNLEALASADRPRAESEIRTLLFEISPRRARRSR